MRGDGFKVSGQIDLQLSDDVGKALPYQMCIRDSSRALRGKDDISAATQALIRKTAEEMGHISNTIASSLRSGYTNTIAVVLGDISNLHFATMMKEIEEYARAKGYTTILLNTNENTDQERQAIQVALSKGVDGILICPTQKNRKNIEYLLSLIHI